MAWERARPCEVTRGDESKRKESDDPSQTPPRLYPRPSPPASLHSPLPFAVFHDVQPRVHACEAIWRAELTPLSAARRHRRPRRPPELRANPGRSTTPAAVFTLGECLNQLSCIITSTVATGKLVSDPLGHSELAASLTPPGNLRPCPRGLHGPQASLFQAAVPETSKMLSLSPLPPPLLVLVS